MLGSSCREVDRQGDENRSKAAHSGRSLDKLGGGASEWLPSDAQLRDRPRRPFLTRMMPTFSLSSNHAPVSVQRNRSGPDGRIEIRVSQGSLTPSRFQLRSAAFSVLLLSLILVFDAAPVQAANDPCNETLRNVSARRYRSTYDVYHNTASFPSIANLSAAMNAGAGGWNEVRRGGCALVEPNWRTSFRHVGNNTRTPDVADGFNTLGWVNFSNPPANEDVDCRNFKLANPTALALTCSFSNSRGTFEFGMSFNTARGFTTDLNSTTRFIVQAVSTHEFGHAIGLDHVPSSGTFADGGALLTMYPEYFLGETNNGWYTLGQGDMIGYREVRP